MMQPFPDWQDVVSRVASCRNNGWGVSNFFPDAERMTGWCRAGVFGGKQLESTMFFVRRQPRFSNVYFMSESADTLKRDWQAFVAGNPKGRWILDLVGPDASRQPLEETFSGAGFARLSVLQRMGRKTPGVAVCPAPGVECARFEDVRRIQCLLEEHFDAETEQLPSEADLHCWIEKGTLLVERDVGGGALLGFAIFDLHPAALHLRYWFVFPSERGKGVGGRLLRSVFAAGNGTRRQYLWVKTDNVNAIVRYQHHGFRFEAVKDVVMGCSTW